MDHGAVFVLVLCGCPLFAMDELRSPPRKRTAAGDSKSEAISIVLSDSEEERLVHLLGLGFRQL